MATRRDHCLDLIYSNCNMVSDSGVLDIMLSDHDMVFITRKKGKTTYNHVQVPREVLQKLCEGRFETVLGKP